MIEGLSHITFVVRDLERTTALLIDIFNAEEVYASGDKTGSIAPTKFFLINHIWIAIIEGKPLSEKTYNHVAFKIDPKDFDRYVERVQKLGLEVRCDRGRVESEGESLYFYDYDNHLFELHTGTLNQRLERYSQQ
jgi:catechol 2,3-dioxygenase-like lactoylglutathione lyase family enzyme